MEDDPARVVELARQYPVTPPAALFVLSLVVNGVSALGWEAAGSVAGVLSVVGLLGAASVCAVLLGSGQSDDRARLWTGLAGALVLGGLQVAAVVHPTPTSIGGGLLVLGGLVLLGIGALAERSPRG